MFSVSSRVINTIAVLLIGVFLSSCISQPQSSDQPAVIAKSAGDHRDYHSFVLPNQLKVLVISDPDTDKAAASLDIQIGSSANPEDRQGLAHFLEHMLFLGTQKYPDAGEYQRYISEHGGTHNAFTAYENTNYFFDIDEAFLAPALDRFAQFFVAPLFNSEFVDREKHAVNSEYQSNLKNDWRRQHEVLKTVANPQHPFSRFFVGSLATLADRPDRPVRDDLLKFYRRYYSANLMTLVVLGHQPVAQLETLIREKFSDIPNHQAQPVRTEVPMFDRNQLPISLLVTPEKDIRQLSIMFPIPAVLPYYRSKPTEYLANLLGHEGKGSLLSYLKQQGWAEQLSAGISHEAADAAIFQITISLTQSGLQARNAVVQALFAKIQQLREQGIRQWRFDEQRRLAQMDFDFKEKEASIHYVTRLAGRLHDYPVAEVLQAPYLMDQFRPALLAEITGKLTPENMILMTTALGFEADRTTQWFSTPYRIEPISAQQLSAWQKPQPIAALALPEPNPFIPSQLQIDTGLTTFDLPQRIDISNGLSLWYSPDTRFGTPRADFYFSVRSPLANNSAANHLLTRLYVRAVNDQLSEFSYPAYLAGLNYQLYSHVRGISVRISGYSDKQPVLLEKITEILSKPVVSAAKFAVFKDEISRELDNAQRDTPYNQALDWLSKLVLTSSWEETQLQAALASLTVDDLNRFIAAYSKKIEVVALANGNLSEQEATEMAQVIRRNILPGATAVPVKHQPVIRLETGESALYSFTVDHPDSALVVYLQAEDKSPVSQARFALFSQLLSAPFYEELRTVQQRGYIVFATPVNYMDVPAMALVIQSPNTGATDLAAHVQAFLNDFDRRVQALTEEEINRHKNALITRIMEKETRLAQRSSRLWREIDRENYRFDQREQLVAAIGDFSLARLKADYRSYLLGGQRRPLTIMANGERFPASAQALENYQLIRSRADLAQQFFQNRSQHCCEQ